MKKLRKLAFLPMGSFTLKKNIIKTIIIVCFHISILLLFSCGSSKEPVFYEKYTFSNENASLYLINLTGSDISVLLEKNDGNTENKIIPTAKLSEDEANNLKTGYLSKERFISFICKIIENADDADNSEKNKLPFTLEQNDLLCSDFSKSGITCVTIKDTDNHTLYSSNVVIPEDDLTLQLAHNTSGLSLRESEKIFANGDFLFTERPGDYLFVDCDVELKEKPDDYYGTIKNPRYIIIISE